METNPKAKKLELTEWTLGRKFADHMLAQGLKNPAAISALKSSQPFKYVRAYLYDTLVVKHVVTGSMFDVAGKLGLQTVPKVAQSLGPIPHLFGTTSAQLWNHANVINRIYSLSTTKKFGTLFAQVESRVSWGSQKSKSKNRFSPEEGL